MVKTIHFGDYRDVGNPVTTAKIYDAQRADELLFLDIDASRKGRGILKDIIKLVSEECFMPFGVGGGIKTLKDIRELLCNGADKVIINTNSVENPKFITEAAQKYGSSTIVVSIDVKENDKKEKEVCTHSARKWTGKNPIEWAKEVAKLGAGEIMITNVDKEGTMKGLDIKLVKGVVDSVKIPIIASGGVGTLEHFKEGFKVGASAIAAGSIFHFTDQSIIKTRKFLVDAGYKVRA